MISIPKIDPSAPIIAIAVGNTNTRIATWHEEQIKTPLAVPTDDAAAFEEAFDAHVAAIGASTPPPVVIGSVVPEALERLRSLVMDRLDRRPLVIGDNLPLPLEVAVDDAQAIGVDRVCAAAAAYDKIQTACVIVDFGTAVTVDLVDDEGALLGGAILPGPDLQLTALAEHTAQLPKVAPAVPETPYGRNTTEAMQAGVCRGLAGAVRGLVEGYATSLNRWPQVVATGGDLELMMEHCDFLDSPVQDLTLRGIGLAYSKFLTEKGA